MELKHFKFFYSMFWHTLLIVPYGIETRKAGERQNDVFTFNCTLWN